MCMVGHIVQPVIHHHVCNIDGIGNYYGLDIASSITMRSEIISTMATTTSALIIAIVVIIIASAGGIKLSMVALVLAWIFILLSPSPMLGTSMWFSTAVLTPIGSMASVVASVILIMIIIVYIFILFFLLRERGRWLRLLLWFGFTFTFLSTSTSCAFEWFW